MNQAEKLELQKFALQLRRDVIDEVHGAKSGHPGGSLSICDTLTYLYKKVMRVDPANPKCPDRDRFVLSKGHTSPALYAVLAECGFFPREELQGFRHTGRMLQGHPDMKAIPGVDMSSGSLGQGLSVAVGMAAAAKLNGKDYKVYTVLGDGEIQEGMVWEAAMLGAHRKLDNLVAIVDNNGLQIDGKIEEVNSPYPITDKFAAFGWHVIEADAHCFDSLEAAFNEAATVTGKPVVIVQKSVKGKGISFMENNAAWHGSAPNAEQYAIAMADLDAIEKGLEA